MIIVLDFETTGLTLHPDAPVHKQPKMIEAGFVVLDPATGAVVRELSQLVHPRESITDEITKITGITNEQLIAQPNFEEFLPQLREFFVGTTVAVAHNLAFDKSILMYELLRLGVTDFPWPAREFCTVGAYREQWGRNPRLIELYPAVTGKPFEQKHRALDDCKHLVEIVQADKLWELM